MCNPVSEGLNPDLVEKNFWKNETAVSHWFIGEIIIASSLGNEEQINEL